MRNASFLLVIMILTACSSAPKRKESLVVEPGLDACKIVVTRNGSTGTIQRAEEGTTVHERVDLDGDGQAEIERRQTHDRGGRLQAVETLTSGGSAVSARETYTWDGDRLVRVDHDRFGPSGEPGPDGLPDETHTYRWEEGRLVAEEIDQVDAEGLLGVDGEPDLVTTWAWDQGERRTGTRVAARDGAVLQVEHLSWAHGQIATHTVDLGGDGQVDVTITHTYRGGRLVRVEVTGELERSEMRYEYCR